MGMGMNTPWSVSQKSDILHLVSCSLSEHTGQRPPPVAEAEAFVWPPYSCTRNAKFQPQREKQLKVSTGQSHIPLKLFFTLASAWHPSHTVQLRTTRFVASALCICSTCNLFLNYDDYVRELE